MRGEVHNSQQAPPPSWQVDVPEENTAASSAYQVHGASEAHSGPAQAAQAWNEETFDVLSFTKSFTLLKSFEKFKNDFESLKCSSKDFKKVIQKFKMFDK